MVYIPYNASFALAYRKMLQDENARREQRFSDLMSVLDMPVAEYRRELCSALERQWGIVYTAQRMQLSLMLMEFTDNNRVVGEVEDTLRLLKDEHMTPPTLEAFVNNLDEPAHTLSQRNTAFMHSPDISANSLPRASRRSQQFRDAQAQYARRNSYQSRATGKRINSRIIYTK